MLGDVDDAGGAETIKLVEQAGGEAVFSTAILARKPMPRLWLPRVLPPLAA